METFLLQLFIFLISASIAVPIAKKFGLGSVLGYLIAGIVIGPFGLSLIGNVEMVMHITEFGVVLMLFLIGLELKPALLWQLRVPILGMGGLQVVLSSLFIFALAVLFVPWQQALAIGLILSLSSTAIVLQTLRERGLMNTSSGQSIFSVLLFQDIAVIPILALLPLLATLSLGEASHHGSTFFDIKSLPGYVQLIVTLSAVAIIFVLAKYASVPVFRAIAKTGVREIFVAAALSMVVGISLVMTAVGLSPALGAFLAGVVLANSEYRHELESDIEPFKGLLLGVFFISIGASLNFTLITHNILMIAGIVFALLALKWLALYLIGLIFKMLKKERSLFAISVAQGGEFAFVLFQFARSNGVLGDEVLEALISAVAISMFLTPILFMLHEKLSPPHDEPDESMQEGESFRISGHNVIIAGFGRLGVDLGRFLNSSGIKPVIVDNDPANIKVLRSYGFEVYYGDMTRLDLLEAAGADQADLIIITIQDIEKSKELVSLVKKHYPHLKIAVNAHDRSASYDLMDLGVENIRLETFGTAVGLGKDALVLLGMDPYEAHKRARLFRKKDRDMFWELYKIHREDEANYISMYQKHNEDLENMINLDQSIDKMKTLNKAWRANDPES